MLRWGLIAILLLPQVALAYDYKGKGTWKPTLDMGAVVIMMHYTWQYPVPCGEHRRSNACAHLPDPDHKWISYTAPTCNIYLERKQESAPSDEELREIGRKFVTCIRGRWLAGWTEDRKQVALVIHYGEDRRTTLPDLARNTTVQGRPCAISIAPIETLLFDDKAQRLGHEVFHCFRGSWHER